jgi:SAM-dependent methyltransferase
MREGLTAILRCPACRRERTLGLEAAERDAREVRSGALRCRDCGGEFPVEHGIAALMPDPPEFVRRESAGLERFAEVMRADGWDRERIRALPDLDMPYWHGQGRAIREMLGRAQVRPGERLLDVGSNTCWASNIFAGLGLEVVALDIATAELQGLRTADYFIGDGSVYFERVLSAMYEPALADASFDHVFCCEVLHHNDRAHLRRTLRELHRVLRPGGRLWIVSEPQRFPLRLKRDHGREVEQFEGNEHVYFPHEYWLAARLAGFSVELPSFFRLGGGPAPLRATRAIWRRLLRGDMALTMDCVKPGPGRSARKGAPWRRAGA